MAEVSGDDEPEEEEVVRGIPRLSIDELLIIRRRRDPTNMKLKLKKSMVSLTCFLRGSRVARCLFSTLSLTESKFGTY